jgi:hypothetical protein
MFAVSRISADQQRWRLITPLHPKEAQKSLAGAVMRESSPQDVADSGRTSVAFSERLPIR